MIQPDLLETLRRKPAPRPSFVTNQQVAEELRGLRDYGPKFTIRRWDERTPAEQESIEIALSAFCSWRVNHIKEELPAVGLWEMPPPDPDILKLYLSYICYRSRKWRDNTVAALRLYFLNIKAPVLFRLVEAPLARQ